MRAGEEMSNKDKGGPDWEKIASGKVRGNLSGRTKGAEGKEKGEAQQLKTLTTQRARQAKQYLQTIGPDQVGMLLTSSRSKLTAKQKAFAYHVAEGATKAEAYRKAYRADVAPSTLKAQPYILAADERIAREIEAYRLAAEAAKHRTAEDLRSLVIQTLVQQVIDPDCPPAVRTQAAKTLGNVTEVAAFTERKESIVHHSSDKLRAQILEQMQALMGGKTVEGERIDQEASSLLAELASSAPSPDTNGPNLDAQTIDSDDTPNAK